MQKNEVLLDSYTLQKDMRIRLPKQILANMPISVGSTFNIYFNPSTSEIILRAATMDCRATERDLGEVE